MAAISLKGGLQYRPGFSGPYTWRSSIRIPSSNPPSTPTQPLPPGVPVFLGDFPTCCPVGAGTNGRDQGLIDMEPPDTCTGGMVAVSADPDPPDDLWCE